MALTSLSCSQNYGYSGFNTAPVIAGNFRAFVSNPVYPNPTGGGIAALQVMDAARDLLSSSVVPLSGSLTANMGSAGLMAVSPKKDRTLVFSPPDRKLGIVDNKGLSLSNTVTLPGITESFFVWNDDTTAYVAVPNASVTGQPAGAIEQINISTPAITATLPVPGAHYIVPTPNGNQFLVFSDNVDTVTVITPALIGNGSQSTTQIPCSSVQVAACVLTGFDRPVWAVFNSSGTTAYIMNCGPQCGGAGSGACLSFTSCTTVGVLDMTQSPPALQSPIQVPAATIGFLQGNTLYVAGTPAAAPDNSCSSFTPKTAATTCGRLSVINLGFSSTPTTVAITDGYHDLMQMGANGQLFIGSRGCTNINVSGGEIRGCLSIVNASSASISASSVVAPPENGDVTGMDAIPNRSVVYVCEGGALFIYNTATDKLATCGVNVTCSSWTQPNIIGQAVDVKMVDF